jgi:hypothetical protein
MTLLPFYISSVISVCKNSNHALTVRTIAKKAGITRKQAKIALNEAKLYVDPKMTMTLRNPLNIRRKRPIWSYEQQQ